jgi:hypothetical protein
MRYDFSCEPLARKRGPVACQAFDAQSSGEFPAAVIDLPAGDAEAVVLYDDIAAEVRRFVPERVLGVLRADERRMSFDIPEEAAPFHV